MLLFNKYLTIVFVLLVIVNAIFNLCNYNNFNNRRNKVICIANCAKQVISFARKLIFFIIFFKVSCDIRDIV